MNHNLAAIFPAIPSFHVYGLDRLDEMLKHNLAGSAACPCDDTGTLGRSAGCGG
jgi:hypothetical protein